MLMRMSTGVKLSTVVPPVKLLIYTLRVPELKLFFEVVFDSFVYADI